MELRITEDLNSLSLAAAEEFTRCARAALDSKGYFSVALSGGTTPRILYQLLAAPPRCDEVDWEKVWFFWGDERAVPPDHEESNFRMAKEALLRRVRVDPELVFRIPAEKTDLDAAAWEYQNTIARVFSVDPNGEPPSLDLVLLGLGPDGHTASLFPYTEALQETARWVVPNYVPRMQSKRVTMTVRILNKSKLVLFLVSGREKASALAEVLEGPRDPFRLPAQLIRPNDGHVVWLVDREAAEELRGSMGRAKTY